MQRISKMGVSGIGHRLRSRLRMRRRTSEELWVALHSTHVPTQNPLFSHGFVSALNGYSPVDDFLAPFRAAQTTELLDRCLYHDLRSYLPGLLHMEDRMSMAVSVESRAPLLDHQIVEFMATVPPRQKVLGMTPKGLLRAAARGTIPEVIRTRRDKRPFPVPFEHWVEGILMDFFRKVLLSPQCLDRGVLDADRIRAWDLTSHELWAALNVELWFQIFIDRDPAWMEQAMTLRAFEPAGS